MTTPLMDTFDTPEGGDIFEERDDDALDSIAEDAGVARPNVQVRDETSPIPGGGVLLQEPDPAKVFKAIDRDVVAQEQLAKNREQAGKHWDRIRRGVQFSILQKTEDQAVWEAILPPGIEDVQQPIPNKVLDLSNKQVSQILIDPPLPNPKPDGDSERNRDAIDLSGRYLRSDGDVSGTNDAELWREVLTLNRTRCSAFVFVWVDPTAGGWRPRQKMAHPQATDPANPLMGPVLGPDDQPIIDQATGAPTLERTDSPVLRYVAEVEGEDGEIVEEFTEHPAEAARDWLPKERRKLLHPNQVRTFPRTATVAEAHSIVLLMWEPLSEARKRFPLIAAMSKAELKKLVEWRPKRWKAIVPEAQRPRAGGLDEDGGISDQALVFWYHKFCRITPDYPDGAEIAVSGASIGGKSAGLLLKRDTLREDVEDGDGKIVPVLREPPIAQFRALIDADYGDPFGLAPVSLYGGANEIRAHLYTALLEDIDTRLHINTFLTANSSLTREDLRRRDDTPLEVLTKDDMPIFEQRPQLPALQPVIELVDHDMDTAANLNQTAQALDSQYSESGVAKQVAIHQAKVQLAQDWQGFINGVLQYWKIKLQLAQAFLKQPQLVKLGGENSSYKARHFVGADMIGVSAVALLPGSGTMMSVQEKAQYLQTGQSLGWIDKEDAGRLFRSAMTDDLGLPPSPHEEHIDRCIAEWVDGPPPGWDEQAEAVELFPQHQQQYEATVQQMVASLVSQGADPNEAQALAQQRAGPAPTPPTPPHNPFEPRANDEEPVVAKVQYQKLSELMSSTEFSKQPPRWRKLVEDKYNQAAPAAGIVTVRQQQQAQAQTAQANQKPDPNAPPEWNQFLAAANKTVVLKAQSLLGRLAAGMGEADAIETKAAAEHIPAELEQQGAEADRTHQANEAERDRQHDLTLETVKHANTMEQIKAKALGTALANAHRQPAGGTGGTPA